MAIEKSQDRKFISSLNRALADFRVCVFKDIIQRSCAIGGEDNSIILRFLDNDYVVSFPDGEISCLTGKSEISIVDRILILHYLIRCRDIPLSGSLLSFRDLPGGVAYENAFRERAIKPIIENFTGDPAVLETAIKTFSGIGTNEGRPGFRIYALPRVPITYIVNSGDNELPGSAIILFDSSAPQHLPTEDLAVLGELTTQRLIRHKVSG